MKIIITELQAKNILKESKITVYRGFGRKYFGDSENEGFLWVANDENVAKTYATLNDDGSWNVDKFEIEKPYSFEFPYKNNTYVTSENIANIFRQLVYQKAKAKLITKEQWLDISKMISQYESAAGDELEPYHTKINKKGASQFVSNILKILGYEAVLIRDEDIETYGIIK